MTAAGSSRRSRPARRGRAALATLGCAVAVAALALGGCGGGGKPTSAGIKLDAAAVDLGTLEPGQRAGRTITLHNPGRRPLVVRVVRTSEEALAATLTPTHVPAGKGATLRIVYRSNSWDYDGTSTDYVVLYTNDPRRPVVDIPVTRTVKATLNWSPRVPALGPIDATTLKPLKVAEVHAQGPLATQSFLAFVSARAVRQGPQDYRIDLVPQEGVQLGDLFGLVKVLTNDPRMPAIELPVRTQVLGNLQAVPYQFDFGVVRQGGPAVARVDLVWKPGHRIRVLRVVTHVPGSPRVQITHRGRVFRFRLRYAHVPSVWDLGGSVDVYSDDPLQPLYRIPVVGSSWSGRELTRTAIRRLDPGYYKLLQAVLFAGDDVVPAAEVASQTLAGDRSPQAIALLVRATHDENWLIRQRALEVLGYLKAPQAAAPARQLEISDPVFEVRRTAVATLGQVEGRKALPEILLGLADDDEMVRADTCDALRKLRDPRSIPALKAALNDPEDIVRSAARLALQAMHVAVPKGTP